MSCAPMERSALEPYETPPVQFPCLVHWPSGEKKVCVDLDAGEDSGRESRPGIEHGHVGSKTVICLHVQMESVARIRISFSLEMKCYRILKLV